MGIYIVILLNTTHIESLFLSAATAVGF